MADAAEKVGIYSSLKEVYGPSVGPEIRARFTAVAAAFGSGAPILYARSPGRVNLIGEHIDYEGYSVLPMAIGLDCIVGIRTVEGGSLLSVSNTDPAYKAKTFADPCGAAAPNGDWTDYVCAGYRGVVDHLRTKSLPLTGLELGGLELVVDGVVPAGGGLSSSSALVCATAIAIMAVRGLSFSKGEVAELACLCERYSGTQSVRARWPNSRVYASATAMNLSGFIHQGPLSSEVSLLHALLYRGGWTRLYPSWDRQASPSS